MSVTWRSEDPPPDLPIGPAGWLRIALKGGALGLVTFGSLALLLLVRLVEAPVFGLRRPWTPHITQFVCRAAFRIIGLRHVTRGTQMAERGAVVANHSSWLDILALNAPKRVYFVSKAEVADWPGIGLLAKATGTVFISRDRRDARAQQALFEARLSAGHKLLFFPEGTSTDGRRVLPFKSTLFAAFLSPALREFLWVQPVSVVYTAPPGQDPRFYAWWGDMEFGAHLLGMLAAPRHGRVEVIYHPPVRVGDHPDRKSLAAACEAAVRGGLAIRETRPATGDPS